MVCHIEPSSRLDPFKIILPEDVTYLRILGQGVVYLAGEAISDLMEKRGSIYADKPRFVMTGEL